MKKKHLLPLFLMVIMILSNIGKVHGATPTFVSVVPTSGNASSSTVVNGITIGDLLYASDIQINASGCVGSISDTQNNVWTLESCNPTTVSGCFPTVTETWVAFAKSGGSDTVTVTIGGVIVADYSGIISVGTPVSHTGTSATDSITVNQVNQGEIQSSFAMINNGSCNSVTIAGTTGQVTRSTAGGGGGFTGYLGDALAQVTGTTTYTISFTPTTNLQWVDTLVPITGTAQSTVNVYQCIGNCGNPPVTTVNTNSTHTINFNVSQTWLYESQITINGFLQNFTMTIACNPTPFGPCKQNQPFLGIYATSSSCLGSSPFTSQCPGNLIVSSTSSTFTKGKFTQPTSVPVFIGEWIGVAFSAGSSGLDINDTNTAVNVFNTAGIMPASITSITPQSTSKANVYAWIAGNAIAGGVPPVSGVTGPCGLLDCVLIGLINSGCGIQTSACIIGAGFFWMVILSGVVIGMTMWGEKKVGLNIVPGEFFLFVPLSFTFLFFEIGVFPFWVPVFLFIAVILLFASMLTGKLHGEQMKL